MNRKAKCSCGQLSIQVLGDPKLVLTCNCFKCQKRTGSIFGVGSYFDLSQIVSVDGQKQIFEDFSETEKYIKRSFCPTCGSTVFWDAEFKPNHIGIAVGCFEDPDFPEPILSAWTKTKHKWMIYPSHWRQSENQEFKR
jgi:hypothetical protein